MDAQSSWESPDIYKVKRRLAAAAMVIMAGLLGSVMPAFATLGDFYYYSGPASSSLYWAFDDGSGATEDWSNKGRLGTVTAADPLRLQPGVDSADNNFAFQFNGVGSVTSPDVFAQSDTFTQMAWVKTTSTTGGFIMGLASASGDHDRMVWISDAGHIYAGAYDSGFNRLRSPATYNDGQWHIVVQTLGPDGWHLYVDSFEVDSDSSVHNAEPYPGTRMFVAGGYSEFNHAPFGWGVVDDPTSSSYFNGSLDEVVYFHDSQKSAEQIRDLYNHAMTERRDADVKGVVDPTLTFTVAGASGSCNGEAQSMGADSTASTVNLGAVDQVAFKTAAQNLTVGSNAANGWSVFVRASAPMTSNTGHAIASVPGTNAIPAGFPALGSEGFGYTTSDLSLSDGTADRFFSGSARWAAFAAGNEVIADENEPTSSTTCVGYRMGVSPTTPAGAYSTQITYTVVPRF